MTSEEREFLAHMELGEHVTARAMARRVWGNDRSNAAAQIMMDAAKLGYVRKVEIKQQRAGVWELIRSPEAEPQPRPGTRVAMVQCASPTYSSVDSTYAAVTVAAEPWL